MTKTELIEVVARRVDVPKNRTSIIINAIIDVMKDSLQENSRIELRGFGTFSPRSYNSKRGRNPKSGEPLNVKEKRSVHFKAGKGFRDRVESVGLVINNSDDSEEE